MENTHKDNNLIDTQEQNIEDYEVEQEEFFEETNWNLITEEELEHIHSDLNHNFKYHAMNSGLMTVYHNDSEILIDDPGYFGQYRSWLISRHGGNTLHPTTTQVITEKLDGGKNSHLFNDITMLTCTRPVKCNIKIINGRKLSA